MLGLASLFSVSGTNDAFAANCSKAANSGHFCKTWGSNNYECRPGCFCPGGSNKEAGAHDVKRACDERWSNETMWTTLHAAQIWLCPESHPKSNAGSDEKTDCYKIKDNGQNEYYSSATEITVDKGEYLPKNSETPITCTNTSDKPFAPNWYCPGGKFTKSLTKDQGIESCPTGTIPSQDKKQCKEPSIVHCEMGWYMPENSPTCAKCNFFMYCPGGDFKTNHTVDGSDWACSIPSFDSGDLFNVIDLRGGTVDTLVIPNINGGPCEKMKDVTVTCPKGRYLAKLRRFCDPCPENAVCEGGTFHLSLYEDQGILDENSITVNPGYYLPKASTESKKCTSTSKYCPGGTFEPYASRDQGQFDCPTGSRATDDKSACAVTLTKKQMMYGINGTGGRYSENAVQCWTKTGADYKACMGFKSDGSLVSTSRSWTFNKSETYYNLASPLVQAASESPRQD